MDKHEFNIKVDQIKKMVSKGDFETAMKIADTIDWRRVRNANLLSMISSVYEKNAEYQEAKDILLIAFERAPIGKRLLYKLTQLALKEGDIEEAESYYREFCDLAGDDSRQDILRYLILKAKGAPLEQLIHSLESYTSIELDEKWLYELADLYHQAGKEEECVRTCDKIMLMFGLGQYVDKAMELKLQYAPLTKYQMDLVENRDKYEEKLRQVEQNGVSAVTSSAEPVSREQEEMAAATRREQVAAMEAKAAAKSVPPVYADTVSPLEVSGYAGAMSQPAAPGNPEIPFQPGTFDGQGGSQPAASGYVREARPAADTGNREQAREEMVSNIAASFAAAAAEPQGMAVSPEESLEVSMKEAEAEASLAEEMSKLSMDGYSEEPVREKTRVLKNVKDLKKTGEEAEKTKVLDEIRHIQPAKPAKEQEESEGPSHLMIEAKEPEKGLEIAIGSLKKAHQLLAYKHPVAKISGEKLNQKGILASAAKLAGKDLIVENAGDLSDVMLEELDKLLEADRSNMLVVLVDNPRQMEGIRRFSPSLANKFHVVTCVEEAEKQLAYAAGKKPVRQVTPEADTAAMHRSAPQREAAAARQPELQQDTAEPHQAVRQREKAAVRQPEARGNTASEIQKNPAVSQAAPRREQAPVRQAEVQREAEPVRQPVPQREPAQIHKIPVQTKTVQVNPVPAVSDNIVQLRNASSEPLNGRGGLEQGKNSMDEPDDGRVMDIDEFAQYCCHYASQIDCNISGKSMLALYERIEIMDEEGVALTKTAAEDLIEEAADRAEKPSIGKRIAGLFSSKYDKEGLLILKEEHFI